ncbi:hypothetical protein SAMN05421678_102383 [Actinopolymorpha cephalotaxi]|uniref:DUF885 domain-containing protein n=1 Tax=Actinopolymorpha cephalotaxi TaxID=504797 RepID=A0A1I2M223_9ACTN|nr:hypothetical protein [Actinopolymorpha cephalotaxi]NYH81519.1 hypothetical protein [Actinopolymorpha cephalotaxi]SFF84739.1 hypothetical protein SAMN05421678_102383 [Actinopolymorpha cephalotaxi]
MKLRDELESVLRAWNAYEVNRGTPAVIDFDCHPTTETIEPATSRLQVYEQLRALRKRTDEAETPHVSARLTADLAYLGSLLGERPPFAEYIRATQGCGAAGWSDEYVRERGELARSALADVGIGWGPNTDKEFRALEGHMKTADAPDAIRAAADTYEKAVRRATGSDAPFNLTIETADVDAYWAYWLDGVGADVRLRLNLRQATFTEVAARQFALHEVLGHGLQGASWSARCAAEDVPWVRLMSVHANQQVLLEGLAQALPLFVASDDQLLMTRVRLDHYTQLVRGELHLAINTGSSIDQCVRHARERVPYWTDAQISDFLTDRGSNPQPALLPLVLPGWRRLVHQPRQRRAARDRILPAVLLPEPIWPRGTRSHLAIRTNRWRERI